MDIANIQREILNLWFGKIDENGFEESGKATHWFKKSDEFDQLLKEKFGESLQSASRGQLDDMKSSPDGCLALVILLDQFSRNIHRGKADAFSNDKKAMNIARYAIQKGWDKELPVVKRYFLYMPFMHSEDLTEQEESLKLFTSLIASSKGKMRERFEDIFTYAQRHYEIIRDFGRYPHRNEVLGRDSTPSEIEFLKGPNSSF